MRAVPASSSATRRATSACEACSTPASSSRLAMRNSASQARTWVGSWGNCARTWSRWRPQDENCQTPARCALLILQVLVGGDEDIETSVVGRCEERSILQCCPAALVRRLDACAGKCSTQWRRRSLIEQDFQRDLRGSGEATARVFEDGVNLFATNPGEPGEKLWYRGASFKVLEQSSHRDAGTAEEPFAADPPGDTLNRWARGPIEHAESYSRTWLIGKCKKWDGTAPAPGISSAPTPFRQRRLRVQRLRSC